MGNLPGNQDYELKTNDDNDGGNVKDDSFCREWLSLSLNVDGPICGTAINIPRERRPLAARFSHASFEEVLSFTSIGWSPKCSQETKGRHSKGTNPRWWWCTRQAEMGRRWWPDLVAPGVGAAWKPIVLEDAINLFWPCSFHTIKAPTEIDPSLTL